jgi:oligopeptidase B
LYKEMLATIQETDYTTPWPDGDWWYYTRLYEGKSYTVHRAPTTQELNIVWDGKVPPSCPTKNRARRERMAAIRSTVTRGQHLPSHKLLAYSTDLKGRRTCQM